VADCGAAFGVVSLVDDVVHFSSLAQACLYRINFTLVLPHDRHDDVDTADGGGVSDGNVRQVPFNL